MLKFRKFLNTLQNLLIVILLLLASFMFYVRYKMYDLSNNLTYLDKKIERLQSDKNLLTVELTYLTSTERILSLIDRNPKVLNEKVVIKVAQLKTKKELIDISLAKATNKVYKNRSIAKK